MTSVIDTSAIVAVLLSEPERAMLVHATRGTELAAPASVHWEVGNALSEGLKRRRLTLAEGQRALTAYAALPIRFVEVDLALSLELAADHGLNSSDAYVLTCALKLRAPLLTLNAGLIRTATTLGIDLVLPAR